MYCVALVAYPYQRNKSGLTAPHRKPSSPSFHRHTSMVFLCPRQWNSRAGRSTLGTLRGTRGRGTWSMFLVSFAFLVQNGHGFVMQLGRGGGGAGAGGRLPSAAKGRVVKPLAVKELFWKRSYVDQLLLPERDIHVWLPPSYDRNPEMRYPVLYCHDGQNLWSPEKSWTGWSWQLGENLEKLIAENQIAEPVVVSIDNDSSDIFPTVRRRHLEYSGETWLGERFLSFLCDELKPCIDSNFRTLRGPEHTSAMGSSMGGLCSFQAVWQRPDVFGNCACLSPVFQAPLLADVALNGKRLKDLNGKLYIDIGGDSEGRKVPIWDWQEGPNAGYWWLDTQLQPGVEAMRKLLDWHDVEHDFVFAEGSRHNERAWAQRIDKPLRTLFGREPALQNRASSRSTTARSAGGSAPTPRGKAPTGAERARSGGSARGRAGAGGGTGGGARKGVEDRAVVSSSQK